MQRTRREFIKFMLGASAGAKFGGGSETASVSLRPGGFPRRILGRTKESVTVLGLGCAWIAFEVDEAQTRATIEAALEGGVCYFDTSPDYRQSEVRLGPALAQNRGSVREIKSF